VYDLILPFNKQFPHINISIEKIRFMMFVRTDNMVLELKNLFNIDHRHIWNEDGNNNFEL